MKTVNAMCCPFTPSHVFMGYALQCVLLAMESSARCFLQPGATRLLEFEGACKDAVTKAFMQAPSAFTHSFRLEEDGRAVFEARCGIEGWVFRIDPEDMSKVTFVGNDANHDFDPYQIVYSREQDKVSVRFVPVEYEEG